MRSKILKAVILFAVFCAGVFLFSGLMNTQVTESASNLEDSTLPVMCVNIAGNRVNRMYGYKVAMEPKQMRDSLIPMTTDREITVTPFGVDMEMFSPEKRTRPRDDGIFVAGTVKTLADKYGIADLLKEEE